MSPAITVDGLSKQYQLGLREASSRTFREALVGLASEPLRRFRRLSGATDDDRFWALRDVSFAVQPGEVVGVIGRNGAGKSTLLKVLSRITEPTRGRATIRGRVSSLLEVGTGFHNELSGRENVFLNAAILGMSRQEVQARFDQIVAFSGVEKFLDTPIKRYSSGMKVRLAFAVAAHLEPEILIIDEVLAVGDQQFQQRCLGKMDEVARSGRTVLFVSHNMAAVDSLCTRGVWLKDGRLQMDGPVGEVVQRYVEEAASAASDGQYRSDDGPIRSVGLFDSDGTLTPAIGLGTDATFVIGLDPELPGDDLTVAIALADSYGRRVVMAHSQHQHPGRLDCPPGQAIRCRIGDLRLAPGSYDIDVMLSRGRTELGRVESALRMTITPRDLYGTGTLPKPKNAAVHPPIHWSTCPGPAADSGSGRGQRVAVGGGGGGA